MRGLILGGEGMLGRAVAVEGRRRGYPVLAVGRGQGDVTRPEAVAALIEAFRPTVAVNCAAYTQVDRCEELRDHAFAVNGDGAANVAGACAAAGVRLLHVSTDYVFDGTATEPYAEGAPTAPLSVYGASKLAGEEAVLTAGASTVVRTSWLFGPGGPNFVATIAGKVREGIDRLRVVDDQKGRPTYTPFLASALWDLAARDATGLYHYGNAGPVTWHGLATEIVRLMGADLPVEPVTTETFPRPARRPSYSVLAVDRFEGAVDRAVEPWVAGLALYLERLRTSAAPYGGLP